MVPLIVQRSATARATELAHRKDESPAPAEDARHDREAAFQDLLALGRLAEPALIRARSISPEEAVRNEASQLIGELRAHSAK